jgi:hypothetical protein
MRGGFVLCVDRWGVSDAAFSPVMELSTHPGALARTSARIEFTSFADPSSRSPPALLYSVARRP